MNYDIIIAGAGAAGLFAAANLPLKKNQKGLILNRASKPGLKLLMSGSGQCNLTHTGDIRNFINEYGDSGKSIRPILYHFNNKQLMGWFTSHGLELYARADGKVFPKSMNSNDVLNLLIKQAGNNGFVLKNNASLTNIKPPHSLIPHIEGNKQASFEADDITVTLTEKNGSQMITQCKRLLISCGGCSYPTTGSDGNILETLQRTGIEITAPKPALVPLYVIDYPWKELSGFSVPKVKVRIYNEKQKKKTVYEKTGALLFTHKNFSGPVILDSSRYAENGFTIELNWLPEINTELLKQTMSLHRKNNKKQVIKQIEQELCIYGLSLRFIKLVCQRLEINQSKAYADFSNNELQKLIKTLFADKYIISGTAGFQQAMATAGGVKLSEINLSTMESKRYQNIYFAGELLDVDGNTGGYNLQFAFSSAMAAAQSIQKTIK